MTQYVVNSEIPWGRPRKVTGRVLTADSFGVRRSGIAVVNWNHWHDNDHEFKNPATWGVTSTGLYFLHTLDDANPIEEAIIRAIENRRIEWSFGKGATPTATREVLEASKTLQIPYKEGEVLQNVAIDHIAYCQEGAFPQLPVNMIGPVPVT